MRFASIGVGVGAALLVISATAADAAMIITTGTPGTTGATALYPLAVSQASQPLSPAVTATFLGVPDGSASGLGGGFITYDFGTYRITDGAGQDLNVYELDGGADEFSVLDVLVSVNGTDFFSINASVATALDLAGDEAHSGFFKRSFDVAGAVAASGSSEFRFLRLDGTLSPAFGIGSTGALGTGGTGFDADAVGVASFRDTLGAAVPEPATWAMMIAGFGMVGAALRRRGAAFPLARA